MPSERSNDAVWREGWRDRCTALLAAKGFPSAIAFASANATVDYVGLAARIGGQVASIQLLFLLRDELASLGRMDEFVADSFCRHAIRHASTSERRGVSEFGLASLFADWRASLGDANADQALAIWKELRPRLARGWRPNGPLDAVLQSAIRAETWKVP